MAGGRLHSPGRRARRAAVSLGFRVYYRGAAAGRRSDHFPSGTELAQRRAGQQASVCAVPSAVTTIGRCNQRRRGHRTENGKLYGRPNGTPAVTV